MTVGTQLPFDRFIRLIDQWASERKEIVVAQTGNSGYAPLHMKFSENFTPDEFESLAQRAHIIVSHAGMGSILTALRLNKPIIIFPRSATLGEHRNDHQLSTMRSFQQTPGIYCAKDETQLISLLNKKDKLIGGALEHSKEYSDLLYFFRELI